MTKKRNVGSMIEGGPKGLEKPDYEMGRTVPVSVGLKQGELKMLDDIAERYGIARNAVMGYFLRYCLDQYYAGELEIPVETETSRKVIMP